LTGNTAGFHPDERCRTADGKGQPEGILALAALFSIGNSKAENTGKQIKIPMLPIRKDGFAYSCAQRNSRGVPCQYARERNFVTAGDFSTCRESRIRPGGGAFGVAHADHCFVAFAFTGQPDAAGLDGDCSFPQFRQAPNVIPPILQQQASV
jgi:hypothetical protein